MLGIKDIFNFMILLKIKITQKRIKCLDLNITKVEFIFEIKWKNPNIVSLATGDVTSSEANPTT